MLDTPNKITQNTVLFIYPSANNRYKELRALGHIGVVVLHDELDVKTFAWADITPSNIAGVRRQKGLRDIWELNNMVYTTRKLTV